LGIGRLSVVSPELPIRLQEDQDYLNSQVDAKEKSTLACQIAWLLDHTLRFIPFFKIEWPKLIGAGMKMARYTVMMRDLATTEPGNLRRIRTVREELEDEANMSDLEGYWYVLRMWVWLAPGDLERLWLALNQPMVWLSLTVLLVAAMIASINVGINS